MALVCSELLCTQLVLHNTLRGKKSFEINWLSASLFCQTYCFNLRCQGHSTNWTTPGMQPAPVSQGQIIYHPGFVKVKLFMGRSDLSSVIGKPPGPSCTDKLSCRRGDALAEGPVNKADGFHYRLFLLCVSSGAQPGNLNVERCTRRHRRPQQVFTVFALDAVHQCYLWSRPLCKVARSFSVPVNSFCQIQSTCLNLLIAAPTHLVHSVN